jgi:hypothetical protein
MDAQIEVTRKTSSALLPWYFPIFERSLRPFTNPQGRFGAVRKHDIHTGVDIYCEPQSLVRAVEDCHILDVMPFTGPSADSPWWNDTRAIIAHGDSGIVVYGEVCGGPLTTALIGKTVSRGYALDYVVPVLKEDKGLPMHMLHIELYDPEWYLEPVVWKLGEPKPPMLLDPTPLLRKGSSGIWSPP